MAMTRKHHETPIGWLTIETNAVAVTKLTFGKVGSEYGDSTIAQQASAEIDEYLAGKRSSFSVKLAPQGTDFQLRVWQALKEIPYGAFPCYSDIAERIGRPKASRAVGMANNKNPIAIMIPCHRVIGRDGSLTGYAGGLDIKKKLLDIEVQLRH